MKKSEENTKNKLEKLAKSLGDFNTLNQKNTVTKDNNIYVSSFKTSEVIVLLLITSIVSLLMGGLVIYKINYNSGKKIDSELQAFIKNYEYITDNYYDSIDKTKLIDSAIAGMLTTLDKNSSYVGSSDSNFSVFLEGNYKGIGIQVYNDENNNVIIYNVINDSPASKAGLQEGDLITKINDESIIGKSVQDVSDMIKKQKKEFNMTYKRGEEEKKVNIEVSDVSLTSVTSDIINKNDQKIGYIRITVFANNTYKQFKKALQKIEEEKAGSLIIDLRDNSGGHLSSAEDIISLFLDSSHPIYQIKSKNGQSKYYSKGNKNKTYKMVILVNGESASASEVLTSALKEQYGATVVGEKTYGKGTVQELQTLPNGEQYKLTTKIWLTSKGVKIDGKGIEPDVQIQLDENYSKDPNFENDNQLQKAIEIVLK